VEATGRYAPVAALGEEGNAVLQRALADEWSSGDELAQQLAAAAGEAEPVALASGGSATGGSQEADPKSAPADPLKKRPWEHRAPRRALALGLVVLVGLGGYAWHRANRRPLPATEARFRLTAASGASSSAPSAAGSVTPEWDLTLPPPAPSPVPLREETPVETTLPSEGGTDVTPGAAGREADGDGDRRRCSGGGPGCDGDTLTDPGRQRGPRFASGCLGTRKPRNLSPANPGTKMPIIIRGSEPKAPKIPSPQHQLRHDRRLRPNATPVGIHSPRVRRLTIDRGNR